MSGSVDIRPTKVQIVTTQLLGSKNWEVGYSAHSYSIQLLDLSKFAINALLVKGPLSMVNSDLLTLPLILKENVTFTF